MLRKWKNVLIITSFGLLFTSQAFALMKTSEKNYSNKTIIKHLELKDAKLIDAAHLIAKSTRLNIVVMPDAGEISVKLFLENISLKQALKTMCKLYNLWFVEEDNAIRIMSVEDYGKELTVRRDEKTFVYNLKYASCLSVAELVKSLFGERIEYVEPEEFESYGHVGTDKKGVGGDRRRDRIGKRDNYNRRDEYEEDNRHKSRTTRYNATYPASRRAKEALEIEKNLTSKKIENLEMKTGGNEIAVRDVLEATKEQAVVCLAVFLRNNSIAYRSGDLKLLEDIDGFIKRMDTPTTQVLLEGKILEVTLTDDFKSFFDFDFTSGSGKHTSDVGNFTSFDSAPAIYQLIDKELSARMELFEENKQSKIIGTPMILCANNAPGDFFIGEERPITINYEQEIREFQERTTETIRPVIELRDIGTKLTITPSINENRTVTMRFLAEVDTINKGGANISLVNQAGDILALSIDTVNSSRVENIIIAEDGSTLAVGGLIRETDQEYERKVPILGDIPLLGFLFKKKELTKKKTETVFLITPHLMMRPDEAGSISDKTISSLSDHPCSKNDHKNLFSYDEKTAELKFVDGKNTQRKRNLTEQEKIGEVFRVYPRNDFAIIDLGKIAGVMKDDVFFVYRRENFIGTVKVTTLQHNLAAVEVIGETKMKDIKKGDKVKTQ